MRRLETLNRVLRIAVSGDLFHREAFEAVARVIDEEVSIGCLAVVVPEPTGKRLYAVSPGSEGARLPPFGIVFPHEPKNETVLTTGKSKIKDDARDGDDLDRIAVHWGFLSYALHPIRSGPDGISGPIVAKLVVAFREAGAAKAAPAELFEEVAAIFGAGFERAVALSRVRRLAMILETSRDAMVAWDADGRITDANAAASVLSGIARPDLLGRSVDELFGKPPATEGTGSTRLAMRRRSPGGDAFGIVPVSLTMTRVADDPLVAAHALIRDESELVTKEREAAQHLARIAELEKELRSILDNTPVVIFRIDSTTGELAYLNRHAERLLGVPTEEALGTRNFLRAIHLDADGMASFDAAVASARSGAVSPAYEARLRGRDGRPIAVRGTVYPLVSDDGGVIAIEGTLADVSGEHDIRQRLVQADRLSTLGTLAASVAHEINNPAAFMLLGLNAVSRMLEPAAQASVEQLIEELREATTRIVDIARDLRLFVSPAPGRVLSGFADPNEVVESALTLARGRLMDRANVVRRLEPVAPVRIDRGRLGQVLVNLLVNAAQALPRTRSDGRENVVTVSTRSAGDLVEIEVADNGVGIPREHLPLIWTPFFTTKDADSGTGLGLWITRDIVERAGGEIRVGPGIDTASELVGTRFVVTLPVVSSPDEPSSAPPPRAAASSGARLSVLVVEDEVTFARRLASALGQIHAVTVVHGGREALRLLSERPYDVVLSDLRMPDVSGEALYAAIRARDEAQARAFVFMTGIGFLPEVQEFLGETGQPVLHKPFGIERALEAIATASAARFAVPGASR